MSNQWLAIDVASAPAQRARRTPWTSQRAHSGARAVPAPTPSVPPSPPSTPSRSAPPGTSTRSSSRGTCAATPVHHPDTGQIIGVIDLTGRARRPEHHVCQPRGCGGV